MQRGERGGRPRARQIGRKGERGEGANAKDIIHPACEGCISAHFVQTCPAPYPRYIHGPYFAYQIVRPSFSSVSSSAVVSLRATPSPECALLAACCELEQGVGTTNFSLPRRATRALLALKVNSIMATYASAHFRLCQTSTMERPRVSTTLPLLDAPSLRPSFLFLCSFPTYPSDDANLEKEEAKSEMMI